MAVYMSRTVSAYHDGQFSRHPATHGQDVLAEGTVPVHELSGRAIAEHPRCTKVELDCVQVPSHCCWASLQGTLNLAL